MYQTENLKSYKTRRPKQVPEVKKERSKTKRAISTTMTLPKKTGIVPSQHHQRTIYNLHTDGELITSESKAKIIITGNQNTRRSNRESKHPKRYRGNICTKRNCWVWNNKCKCYRRQVEQQKRDTNARTQADVFQTGENTYTEKLQDVNGRKPRRGNVVRCQIPNRINLMKYQSKLWLLKTSNNQVAFCFLICKQSFEFHSILPSFDNTLRYNRDWTGRILS